MMKKRQLLLLCCAALLLLASACGKNSGGGSMVTLKDLTHHRFVLVSVNGKDFSGHENIPSLEFGEGLHITGAVCNRFMGQGQLKGNILTVDHMASTRMLCADQELNELETNFARMLAAGAELELVGPELVVRQGDTVLRYTLADWVN